MRKLSVLAFLALFLCAAPLFGQDKVLDLTDINTNPALYPKRLRNLAWRPETGELTYFKQGENDKLTAMDVKKGESYTLLSLEDLQKAMPEGVEEMRYIPSLEWKDANTVSFTHDMGVYTYNFTDKKAKFQVMMPHEGENYDLSSAYNVAFTLDHNLYLATPGNSDHQEIPGVSGKGSLDVTYGEAAHRSEFGITKGTFWSPKGHKLAFFRQDQSMVSSYPLIDYMEDVAEHTPIKYPMAGQKSHHVTVGIYDLEKKSLLYLKTGEPKEQYLTNITWSPDEKEIYVAHVNRDQNHMELKAYDVATGQLLRTLFEEKDEEWVEPEHGPYFLDNQRFVWFSERDGYNHLYLYNTQGKLLKQLTKGNWIVTEILGKSEDNETLYLETTKESPLERHAYTLDIKKGILEKITSEKGMHGVQLSPDGKYFVDVLTNRTIPYKAQVFKTKNGKPQQDLYSSPNPLKDYKLGKVEVGTLKAEDDTPLYYRLIKPANFEEGKKYPVLVYVYGGPHAQLITESWADGGLYLQHLAQQGFVVFTLDNRGSANRGLEFEQAIHRKLGEAEMSDQLRGVEFLKSLPYVDSERMGVYGWSFGGFMSTSLMTRHPEVFQCGVAGGPVINWEFYEVMYTERYMDTPEQNPEGYKKSNLLNYAGELKGKHLIIHGLQDNVVVPQHSRRFVRRCIQLGTFPETFFYPTHEHNVGGVDRAHLQTVITNFLKEHLMGK